MAKVIEGRLKAREKAIQEAREFTSCITEKLGSVTAILFGSYARGDFNEWSDIDVLIVAENLPQNPLERLNIVEACLKRFTMIEPVIITTKEFVRMRGKNPAIIEAMERGIVLVDGLGLINKSKLNGLPHQP